MAAQLQITDLPPEILIKIFSYLRGTDLANLPQVCRLFRDIAEVEAVWQTACLGELISRGH